MISVKGTGLGAVGGHGFFQLLLRMLFLILTSTLIQNRFLLDYRFIKINPKFLYITIIPNLREQKWYSFLSELKDYFVANKAPGFVKNIAPQNRFFLFVHFCEPDCLGHFYGENSQEYSQTLISNDRALGILIKGKNIDGFNGGSLCDETLIIVTTDHGATENAPGAKILKGG